MPSVHFSLCLVQPLPEEGGLVLKVGPLGQAGLQRGRQLLSLREGGKREKGRGGEGRGGREEGEEEGNGQRGGQRGRGRGREGGGER